LAIYVKNVALGSCQLRKKAVKYHLQFVNIFCLCKNEILALTVKGGCRRIAEKRFFTEWENHG
jgi:hypothetical protein